MAETPRGIQATLFDYFQDTEYFDLQEANELLLEHQQRDINAESIRARIYEGIDKGLFERVGKGLYTVTRKDEQGRENTCLLINGDGRDLSMFADNSLDAIITDHPWDDEKSLKGGNRNFAEYDRFEYTEEDFKEKHRVLKSGHFLVEFLPEENANNYQYLFRIKEMARKAGMEYFAKVGWVKGDFVANTGRKSKNIEDVCFFTKGRARDLRPNAKKDKQYAATHETVEFKDYIPGSTIVHASEMGSMGTSNETRIDPIDVNIKISVLKEDVAEAKRLLDVAYDNAVIYSFENSPLDVDNGGEYTWEELDDMPVQEYIFKYLDKCGLQYDDVTHGPVEHYMSGAHGMLPSQFIVSPPGRKEKIHQAEKPLELLEQILNYVTLPGETALDQFAGSGVLGEAALRTGRNSILIEKDVDSFEKIVSRLQVLGDIKPVTSAAEALISIGKDALVAQDAFNRTGDRNILYDFIKTHDIKPTELYAGERDLWNKNQLTEEQRDAISEAFDAIEDIDLRSDNLDIDVSKGAKIEAQANVSTPKVLECSSRGDRRFSALFATVTIKGKEQSIEEWFLNAKRTADGKKAGKGKPFDHIVDPFTGDKLPVEDAPDLYRGLWITYLNNNPELVAYASQFDEFTDSFQDPDARKKQIEAYNNSPLEDKEAEFFYHHSGLLTGADVIGAYVKGDTDHYVATVKASHWYKNMASKKKPPLSSQIAAANKAAANQQPRKVVTAEHDR